jgi:hypothetical protein
MWACMWKISCNLDWICICAWAILLGVASRPIDKMAMLDLCLPIQFSTLAGPHIPSQDRTNVQDLHLQFEFFRGYLISLMLWRFDPADFGSVSYKKPRFRFDSVRFLRVCPIMHTLLMRWRSDWNWSNYNRPQSYYSSVAKYAPLRLAATDITQFHGPAT